MGTPARPGDADIHPRLGDADEHIRIAVRDCDVVFILPCKVASSSIRRALRQALFGNPNIPPDRLDYVAAHEVKRFRHRIGFVRHPLERLESCYADKFILRPERGKEFLPHFRQLGFWPEMTFPEFVARVSEIPDFNCHGDARHFRSQHVDLFDRDGPVTSYLGRFEHLAHDWAYVREWVATLGLELPELPHLRKSDHSYTPWTEQARQWAVGRFIRDLVVFNYTP